MAARAPRSRTSAAATCAASTRTGARCRRKAAPGARFCSQHAAEAPAAGGAVPEDIDPRELASVLSDLGGSDFPGATGSAQSLMDDVSALVEFLGSNVNRIREAAHALGVTLDVGRVERFASDLITALASLTSGLATRASGSYEEDDFGFDEAFTEALVPLFALLYDYYWRVDVTGIENVPASGRGLLVSNHAGAGLPFDGAMVKLACWRDSPNPRHLRMLVLDWLMGLPYLADFVRTTGQVLASSANAQELLRRDELVAVFPEGIKGMAKNFPNRYNLERFGRGGFVRVALTTGSPIIPVAVVGSEEIYPKIGNIPLVHRLIGAPFVPMTPTFPLLGLLGLIPLPSKWHIEFCEPIDVSQYPPEAIDDRSFVLELSERIRSTIQERLHENLKLRTTPFW